MQLYRNNGNKNTQIIYIEYFKSIVLILVRFSAFFFVPLFIFFPLSSSSRCFWLIDKMVCKRWWTKQHISLHCARRIIIVKCCQSLVWLGTNPNFINSVSLEAIALHLTTANNLHAFRILFRFWFGFLFSFSFSLSFWFVFFFFVCVWVPILKIQLFFCYIYVIFLLRFPCEYIVFNGFSLDEDHRQFFFLWFIWFRFASFSISHLFVDVWQHDETCHVSISKC